MKNFGKKIIALILVCMLALSCAMLLTGCIDDDYSLLETKLEDQGWKANSEENPSGISGCFRRVKAEYGDSGEIWYEYLVALYFNDEDSAIAYYNEIEEYSVSAIENEPFYNGMLEDFKLVRVFTIVLYGTSDAIETALE